MPGLHARYRIDPVVNVCTLLFSLGLIAMAFVHAPWLAAVILVFLGINWVIIPTNFNTATQKSVPPWVKGRAISWYLTVLFGSFAIGSAIWGPVTTATNMHTSLLLGGVSMALLLCLARWFPLTVNEGLDLTPAFKPGVDATIAALLPTSDVATPGVDGPVEVQIDYKVDPSRHQELHALMRQVARQRKRNGAIFWRKQIIGQDGRCVETFRFASRSELSRQRGRMSVADSLLHEQLLALHTSDNPPVIRQSQLSIGSGIGQLIDDACDRFIDELATAIGRIRGKRF